MRNETHILPLPLSTRLEIWKTIYRDLHAHKKLRWDNSEEFEKDVKSSFGEERLKTYMPI